MANWLTLTAADIRLLDTEKTIMSQASPLQTLDTCVTSACNYVRGYVAGGGNTMEAAPAVPPECKDDVVAIARFTYLTQDPTGTLLTDIRKKEYDSAIGHLRDVAKEIASVTQGALPPNTVDITVGKWGAYPQVQMISVNTPPPANPIPTPP